MLSFFVFIHSFNFIHSWIIIIHSFIYSLICWFPLTYSLIFIDSFSLIRSFILNHWFIHSFPYIHLIFLIHSFVYSQWLIHSFAFINSYIPESAYSLQFPRPRLQNWSLYICLFQQLMSSCCCCWCSCCSQVLKPKQKNQFASIICKRIGSYRSKQKKKEKTKKLAVQYLWLHIPLLLLLLFLFLLCNESEMSSL